MPIVGAKPGPPLHGALQWTGSNEAEFEAFALATPANVTPQPNGTLWINSGFGQFTIPVSGWLVTGAFGRGIWPTQLGGGGGAVALTDEQFQGQFTTSEDWPSDY